MAPDEHRVDTTIVPVVAPTGAPVVVCVCGEPHAQGAQCPVAARLIAQRAASRRKRDARDANRRLALVGTLCDQAKANGHGLVPIAAVRDALGGRTPHLT